MVRKMQGPPIGFVGFSEASSIAFPLLSWCGSWGLRHFLKFLGAVQDDQGRSLRPPTARSF